jgi:nucleotide-binding universal stress UspA family protein
MHDRILVPTDGSVGTQGAVEHAIALANAFDAELHVLYVVDTNAGAVTTVPGTLEALESAGHRSLEAVRDQASAAGVGTIEGIVSQGTPHRAILDYVDEADVDLVVMGTHGRTGLDRYLLGSVTEKVVRLSETPVMTVRLAADADDDAVPADADDATS